MLTIVKLETTFKDEKYFVSKVPSLKVENQQFYKDHLIMNVFIWKLSQNRLNYVIL